MFSAVIDRLRQASGLILLVFVLSHLANHAAGIISLEAQSRAWVWFGTVWQNDVTLRLLAVAAIVHVLIALYGVYVRRSFRLAKWEWAQLLLGLSIPLLIADHLIGTRAAFESVRLLPSYAYIQWIYWVASPGYIALQTVLVLVVWTHGCIGLHFWLRVKRWYAQAVPVWLATAILIPSLALAGFVSSGIEVMALAEDPEWVERMLRRARHSPESVEFTQTVSPQFQTVAVALVALAVVANLGRRLLLRRRSVPALSYPDGVRIPLSAGMTVLEASRAAGVPHASVCGGRGRCSTCRVRVGRGADALPVPSAQESRVLARIGSPGNVRLACQIRPTESLEVVPLLPPTAGAEAGYGRPRYHSGEELEIAILFADLRGFTKFSDTRLPYDVVYVLNRYFAAMGTAVASAGGRIDKFIGDGVMALFGLDGRPGAAAREALMGAKAMAEALKVLNQDLSAELAAPLRMGIGVHFGPVIVGEMGHGDVKGLTAIGDAVNVASRLEGLTKEFGVQLVASEVTVARAGIDLANGDLKELPVRGKSETLKVMLVSDATALAV